MPKKAPRDDSDALVAAARVFAEETRKAVAEALQQAAAQAAPPAHAVPASTFGESARALTPQEEPRWHERHPFLKWSAIGTVVGLIFAGQPVVATWLHYYETVDDASIIDSNRRIELSNHQIADIRDRAQEAVTAQRLTNRVALADLRALRNRVNDCDILRAKRPYTQQEQQSCDQYRGELSDGNRLYDMALQELARKRELVDELSREQPIPTVKTR